MSKKWYVVHVFSGSEKKVCQNIEEQVVSKNLEGLIEQVLVPTEEVIEIRRGSKVQTEKKFFPGYILIKMEITDESWHLIKAQPKVTGFLGAKGRPTAISEVEAKRLISQISEGVDRPRSSIIYEIGEEVRVSEGPFQSFNGLVEEIDEDKSRLKVAVSIFGRSTPVDLEYTQVEKDLGKNLLATIIFVAEVKMAKKIDGYIKLNIPAGAANPSPPVGPALGQRGVNIMEFCKAFNASTDSLEKNMPIPVVITVFSDKSFSFVTKTPPVSFYLKKAAGKEKGSSEPGRTVGGSVKINQVREIAENKMKDLNAADIDGAIEMVKGSARSMGLEVVE